MMWVFCADKIAEACCDSVTAYSIILLLRHIKEETI